jgi:F0F1-type ATP synthase assembly protein I
MKKAVLGYGLASAVVSVASMLAVLPFIDRKDYARADVVGYTSIVLAALLVFFGIRSYRDNAGQGRLSFWRGCAVGLLITLVSCVCSALAFELVYFKVMPEFGGKFAACMVDRARAGGASAQEVEETERLAQKLKGMYDDPLLNAGLTFAQHLPIGLVAAAISAAILRR